MNKASLVKTLEFLTVVAFGVGYWKYDLKVATMILMAATTLFVLAVKILGEKLTKLQLFTWIIVLVLGAASLSSDNEVFIKWKTTVINSILALIVLGSQFIGRQTILERLLLEKVKCPPQMLRRLNLSLALYFIFVGLLNLFVAYEFETSTWVKFKLFGVFFLNFSFLCGALYYLRDYVKDLFTEAPPKS